MQIKRKNYYSCLIVSVVLMFFTAAFWINYETFDYKAKFATWLFSFNIVFVVYCIIFYLNSLTKRHSFKIENGEVIFDNKRYKIDDFLKFKILREDNSIWVSLYIGKKEIFKRICFDYDEFDRFLYIIKPYLKKPHIVKNINFKDIKLFKDGFFIKHKKFFYGKVQGMEIYKRDEYPFKFLILDIIYNNRVIEKKIHYDEENIQKLVFILIKLRKSLRFKYLRIIDE